MEEFRKTLDECELNDLNSKGSLYTWHGTRGNNRIWERLDRFISNTNFEEMFNKMEVHNLDWLYLDHRPIEIDFDNQHYRSNRRKTSTFKFEECWTGNKECVEIIKNNGNWAGTEAYSSSLAHDMLNCSEVLHKWGKEYNAD